MAAVSCVIMIALFSIAVVCNGGFLPAEVCCTDVCNVCCAEEVLPSKAFAMLGSCVRPKGMCSLCLRSHWVPYDCSTPAPSLVIALMTSKGVLGASAGMGLTVCSSVSGSTTSNSSNRLLNELTALSSLSVMRLPKASRLPPNAFALV